MTAEDGRSRVLKFGTFELDLAAGELRKNGRKVRVQDQPFQLLAALVEKPGEIITREELKAKLWPSDTYVDFDRSLNTAASKLRDALGDSALSPRFIETLPRRGYRFLASVETMVAPSPSETASVKKVFDRERMRWLESLRWAWLVAGLALVSAVAVLVMHRTPTDTQGAGAQLRKFTLPLPGFSAASRMIPTATVSPNGKYITYASTENRKLAVWDLSMDRHQVLEGTERAIFPFWSPDSESIGFWAEDGEIKRVSAQGGPVTSVTKVSGCCAYGTWSPDGESIVFTHHGKLFKVSARGGDPHPIVLLSGAEGVEEWFHHPHFLPLDEGQFLVFASESSAGDRLMLLDLDSGRSVILTEVAIERDNLGYSLGYSPSGHLVYAGAGQTIWALPFSLRNRQVTGKPFPIAENGVRPSVAADQTLVFEHYSRSNVKLVLVNRLGEKLGEVGQSQGRLDYFSLSPDDRFVAGVGSSSRAWVHEVGGPNSHVLPFRERLRSRPVWSASGKEILFSSPNGLFVGVTDGSQDARLLYDPDGRSEFASDWSRDGTYVFYDLNGQDIWYVERNEEGGLEAKPFLTSEFAEKAAQISPDNRWIAYVSDESGVVEVYLRRFPEGDMKRKVSRSGGRGVRWSRDGRKLYYMGGQMLFEVNVSLDLTPKIGTPRKVLEWPGMADAVNVSSYPRYDVLGDGERFVVPESLPENRPEVRIIQNWYEEFRNREQD